MVVHTFNPSNWEAEAGGYLWVWGQSGLQKSRTARTVAQRNHILEKNEKKKKYNPQVITNVSQFIFKYYYYKKTW